MSETCTATVTNGDSGYTVKVAGTVNFGGTLPPGMLTSCTMMSGTGTSNTCNASWTPASTTEGSYSISASYVGDTHHASSSTALLLTFAVSKATSNTAVICIPTSITVGATSTCTTTVLGVSSPDGTVTFSQSSGTSSIFFPFPATCTLSSGSCSLTVMGADAGNVTILATYSGDTNNLPSSGTTSITANPATPGTAVICGSSTVLIGTSAICTATVTGYYPTGAVSWSQAGGTGSVTISHGSCTLSASYQCQVVITGKSIGSVTLNAAYFGDTNNLPSNGTVAITVNSVTVTCTPTPVVSKPTVCRAVVIGSPLPGGKVTWSSSGSGKFTALTCRLHDGACRVRYVPSSASSPVNITASYSGDTKGNRASSGTFSLTVTQATSKITLSCSRTSVKVGKTVKCTAIVTGYKPSGTMSWSEASTNGGSFTFSSSTCTLITLVKGHCFITMTGASTGTVTIQAVYSGDTNNAISYKTRNLTVK